MDIMEVSLRYTFKEVVDRVFASESIPGESVEKQNRRKKRLRSRIERCFLTLTGRTMDNLSGPLNEEEV